MSIYLGSRYRSLKINSENYILSCLESQGFKYVISEELSNLSTPSKEKNLNKKIDVSGIMGYFKKGYAFDKMNKDFINKYCQPVDVSLTKEEVKSFDMKGVKNCFNIYKEVGWSLKINGLTGMADEFGKMSSDEQKNIFKILERRIYFRGFLKH